MFFGGYIKLEYVRLIEFKTEPRGVTFRYKPDSSDDFWIPRELQKKGNVCISRVFQFENIDLMDRERLQSPEFMQDPDFREQVWFEFHFARLRENYYVIDGRHLGIENEIWLQADLFKIERKMFVAERNINIFKRISKLKGDSGRIVISDYCDIDGAIPGGMFSELLAKFPNTTEMDRYAGARVEAVIGEVMEPMKSAREAYELYLNKRASVVRDEPLSQADVVEAELDKYIYLRDLINKWLDEEVNRSEADWQAMIKKVILLLFPKYIAVLENVTVADFYSKSKKSKRQIDLCLVDASGAIDVVEIKKPSAAEVLAKTLYRDNFTPTRELTGSVIQVEKYLFHLSKWGRKGEDKLTDKYKSRLPPGVSIRVANPKGIVIMGRSPSVRVGAHDHKLDLEVIKRQYANIVDILTYDDLLTRLDNVIFSLTMRKNS